MNTREYLEDIMKRYTADKASCGLEELKRRIDEFVAMDDWVVEGYSEEEKDVQRDKSVRFEWGHDHDFGDFKMKGAMGDRHIGIIERFIDDFGLPRDLSGEYVLDIGVWTGGTSLILEGMGAFTIGIEEVKKYALCADWLKGVLCQSPGRIWNESVYDIPDNAPAWMDGLFTRIIFPGVLYHLSDPILALRILFNCLKDGGELYIETAGREQLSFTPVFEYFGASKPGWNWFLPNQMALNNILSDVGFSEIDSEWGDKGNRIYAKATRNEWKPMLQAGLSRRIR